MNNEKQIEKLKCAKKYIKLLIKRIDQIRGDFSSNGTATDELRSIVDGTPDFIKESINKDLNGLRKSFDASLSATEKGIDLINIINNHKDITVVICDSIEALEEALKD